MKAYYLTKYGDAHSSFEERSFQIENPNDDDVQIKVEAFGLNFADVMARLGMYRSAPPLPCVLGYEVVGEVIKVGKNVNSDLVGKRVLAFTRFGGYATHVNTFSFAVVPIENMKAEVATALATQYVTAHYMFYYQYKAFKNDHILIHAGSGGVGTALIQMAQEAQCNITTTVGNDSKKKNLLVQGLEHVINYNDEDYFQHCKNKDLQFDTIFNPIAGKTFKKDFKLLNPGGKIILFGGSERTNGSKNIFSTLKFVYQMGIVIPITLMMNSKSIVGVNMLTIADEKPNLMQRLLNEVVERAKKGIYQPKVGGIYPIEKLAEAHEHLESRKSEGKLTVKIY